MYKLVISDDEGKTIIVPLVRDLITVGRQDGNTIRLTERNVSRQHARLLRTETGYRIEDLDSYNGVLLNGTRVDKACDLKDGDRVGIGDYIIALKAEPDSKAVPAPDVGKRSSAPPSGLGSPPARLVMISAPAPGAEFSIARNQVRIGRLEELDLCISHRSISREHARITQKDGTFEIEDLNSANGVRINGSGVRKSTLKSGDILELGQVRFRFVGPGEAYTFDPSEEEQAASGAASAGPQKRTVAAIVVTAAVVGGALAFLDQGGKQAEAGASIAPTVTPEPATTVYAATPEPVVHQPNEEARSQIAAALEGCRTALAAERFADAVKAAENGLALVDGEPDADLQACKRSADEALAAAEAFEAGKTAFAAGRLEAAYERFSSLPEGSPYRERPEIKQAAMRLAQARLGDAKRALRTNPAEAQRLARAVLNMKEVTPNVHADAQRMLTLANRAAPAAADAARARAQAAAQSEAETAAEGESPAKIARNCLARGDQRCAVRALEGRTENAQELALLIETYRALGETKKAVKHMETFVQRYPSARQAPQYRLFIAKHEQ